VHALIGQEFANLTSYYTGKLRFPIYGNYKRKLWELFTYAEGYEVRVSLYLAK